jgi:flagella basal body P-ring formation protein FlgA
MQLVRSLSAGSQVSSFDVEEVPGVEKGQAVQLVARVGSVVATTTGRALERARIGEGVRVENVGSGRVLQGTLRETGIVEIRSDFGR